MNRDEMVRNVFVVGSPRSGTTLLGEILDLHPQICEWYEPVFIWDRFFCNAPDDFLTGKYATDEVKKYVRNAFAYFRKRSKKDIILDKSPGMSISFVHEVFPKAKFIHVLRDGRDTILSIRAEWLKRERIYDSPKNIIQALKVINVFIGRQPFIEHKISALLFEIGNFSNLFRGHQQMLYRVRRWQGKVIGWGPRIKNWQNLISKVSLLEYNALQWKECVQAVLDARKDLDSDQFLEIRYESLLKQPIQEIERIFNFLDIQTPDNFFSQLPSINKDNSGKWKNAFSQEEKAQIGRLINPLLVELGYASDDLWYLVDASLENNGI